MNLHLLNEVVLEEHNAENFSNKPNPYEKSKTIEVGEIPLMKRYTYSEIVCFKFFGRCQKKTHRFLSYKKHVEVYKLRLDVRKLIKNQGDVGTLSVLIMKPFQAKIASKLDLQEESDRTSTSKKYLTIEDALSKLDKAEIEEKQ